jgi:tetratricopeptide (TPR) repeat protein
MGLQPTSQMARQNLGIALARLGALDEGAQLVLEALEAFRRHGSRHMEAGAQVYLVSIHRLSGRLEEALAAAEAALEIAPREPAVRASALGALARARLDLGQPRPALSAAREAVKLVQQIGGVEEGESGIRLAYAEALWAVGQKRRAKKAIEAARDRLLERAERITHPAWRASFLERVPENARTLELYATWVSMPPHRPVKVA